MTAEILGYKGVIPSSEITDGEREEYRDLLSIFKNTSLDVLGRKLYNHMLDLEERSGQSGMIYCPYIPLMSACVVIDPSLKLKTQYGPV